ncbi:MAG: UDP-N-acetylglucosamine 1-carboxyvinyltransferase [Bacteriovoracaceae bacterium]|nr:UDP-N-acetylglucosamine 1-carboxyvinyltransferase [Bacteriovoracaceae bacterium]
MDKLVIDGPSSLSGVVEISRAKNSVLKLLAACLMTSESVIIEAMPELQDVKTMLKLLKHLGAEVTTLPGTQNVKINCEKINQWKAHYELVKTMRASILVLGPLLGRFGQAEVSLPGGCAIGARPIDIHLKGLEKLGAKITLEAGYVRAEASELVGATIVLPFPSVGATENIMMAAVFAKGKTVIENAAKEPEISDLGNFLMKLFPELVIEGDGTSTLTIHGVDRKTTKVAQNVTYLPIGDRIEAATYLMAAVTTNSEVTLTGFYPKHISAVTHVLEEMGANLEIINDKDHPKIKTKKYLKPLKAVHVDTAPYPGFPTDAQAQLMAVMLSATGTSVVTEHIFENRFMHVPELERMGAKITLKGNAAVIEGPCQLKGAPVMCTDLRASAALVVAALNAEGKTDIQRVYHLDRGYENLEEKLSQLGCVIKRERA